MSRANVHACAGSNSRWSQLVWGVFLMAVGLVLTLVQTGVIDIRMRDLWRSVWRYWPAILLLMGFASFVGPPRADGRREGGWLMFIGLLGMLDALRYLRWGDSWPLFIVAIGASIALEAVRRSQSPPLEKAGAGQERPESLEEGR